MMNARLNDETVELLQRLLHERNPLALQYLFEFGPRLEISLRRKFGSLIAYEDVQNIVADALVRAYETGDRFDPTKSRLTTWLNQLAHYEALTFLRSQRMLDGRAPEDLEDKLVAVMNQQLSPHLSEPSSWIASLLSQLSDGDADLLDRYYYDGLNEERIAELLGTNPRAIRTRLSRARKRLGKLISAEAQHRAAWRDEEGASQN